MEEKIKILVVEDEEDLLRSLESDLEEIGFQVYTATNGLEALDLVKKIDIDLILSDLNMPQMSGVQMLQQLRTNRFHSPFIVHSGFGSRDEMVELLKLGAYDFLSKPTSFEDLKKVLLKAAHYSRILRKAVDEVKASFGSQEEVSSERIEEVVYALASMKALRQTL